MSTPLPAALVALVERVPALRPLLARLHGATGEVWQQVAMTLLAQVGTTVLAALQGLLIARWLGAEGKGIITVMLPMVAVLALLLGMGIGQSIVYYTSGDRIPLARLTRTAMLLVLVMGLVAWALIAWGVAAGWLPWLIPGLPWWGFVMVALLFPIQLMFSVLVSFLRGLQQFRHANLMHVAQATLMVLFTVLVWAVGGGLFLVVAGTMLAWLLVMLGGMVRLARAGAYWLPAWDGAVARSLLSFGGKSWAGQLMQYLNLRLDSFIVNFFVGTAAVGVYSVSVTIGNLLWMLPQSVVFVLFPTVANSDPHTMNRLTGSVFRTALWLLTAGAVGLAVVSYWAIEWLYGAEFRGAYPALLLLLPGVILLGVARILMNDSLGRGFPHYYSYTTVLGLVLTVGGNLWFIPRFGIEGAAISSSVAYTVVFLGSLVLYRRACRLSVVRWQAEVAAGMRA